MSKSCAIGRHASSSSGWRATRSTRLCTRIHCFRMPRRRSSLRELEAARRVIPEQIVGDEDVVADRRRSPRQTDSIDRSRTARACSCQIEQNEQRNGQPRAVSISHAGRCARHAYCLPPRRRRDAAPAAAPRRARACRVSPAVRTMLAVAVAQRQPGHRRQRHRPASSASADRAAAPARRRRGRRRRRRPTRNGVGIRRRGVAADDDRHVGRRARGRARASASTSSVSSACMAAMPTSAGTQRAQVLLERAAEAQIGERDAVAARFERRRDVFHAERLDAEERAEPEAFVRRARDGAAGRSCDGCV